MLNSLIALDERVFHFLHGWYETAPRLWEFIAVYPIYFVPLVLIWFWFARRRETTLSVAIMAIFVWQIINKLVAQLVSRTRPVDLYDYPLSNKELFFHRPDTSFPSDHTAFLTALVVLFALNGQRQLAWGLIAVEAVIVLARVVVGFHWPGDILGGIVVGLAGALLLWSVRRWVERYMVGPLVAFARKLGL